MTDSMPERKLSDAFTGINIEESLKSKLSSLGFGEYSRKIFRHDKHHQFFNKEFLERNEAFTIGLFRQTYRCRILDKHF